MMKRHDCSEQKVKRQSGEKETRKLSCIIELRKIFPSHSIFNIFSIFHVPYQAYPKSYYNINIIDQKWTKNHKCQIRIG